MDGQTDPPVNGGRTGSRDDPGLEPFQHGLKAAKVCWHVVNGGSSVAQEAFCGAEKAAAIVDALLGQNPIQVRHEGSEDLEVLEVCPFAKGVHEATGNTWSEGHCHGVG